MSLRLVIVLLILCHTTKIILEFIYQMQNKHDNLSRRFMIARVVDIMAWTIYVVLLGTKGEILRNLPSGILIISTVLKIKEILKVKGKYNKWIHVASNLLIVAIIIVNIVLSFIFTGSNELRILVLYIVSTLLWIYPSYIFMFYQSSFVQKMVAIIFLLGHGICMYSSYRMLRILEYRRSYTFEGINIISLVILYITMIIGNYSIMLFYKEISSKKMQQLADYDTLTNIMNRRRFIIESDEMIRYCVHKDEPITCMLIDIDDFKVINDTNGHQVGDFVLSSFTMILKQIVEPPYVLGRIGGEEFALLLPGIEDTRGDNIAEHIRKSIETRTKEDGIPYTISVGITTFIPKKHSTFDLYYELSDRALYRAKRMGKNCVQRC